MPTTLHLWKSYVVPAALGGFLSPAGIQSPISAVGRQGGVSGGGGRRNGGEATREAVEDAATARWSPCSRACRRDGPRRAGHRLLRA